MSYPAFVNGEPPVISLQQYDVAEWAKETCVDSRGDYYVVVLMQQPDRVIARLENAATETLDQIFKSAHKTFAEQKEGK